MSPSNWKNPSMTAAPGSATGVVEFLDGTHVLGQTVFASGVAQHCVSALGAGTVLQPGTHTPHVVFTPVDTTTFTSASRCATIDLGFSAACVTSARTGRFTIAPREAVCGSTVLAPPTITGITGPALLGGTGCGGNGFSAPMHRCTDARYDKHGRGEIRRQHSNCAGQNFPHKTLFPF